MRLTWRRADGAVCPRVVKGTDCDYILREFTQKVYDKLAAYEDAEEQGRLVIPQWIPVTERLPEIGTYIIAGRMKYDYENEYTHFVDVAYFGPRWNDADYSWQTFNDWCEGQQEFEITHWMPLPEPPKEVEE